RLHSRWAGALAGLAFAAQQGTLMYSLNVCTETLGTFLTIYSFHELTRAVQDRRAWPFLSASVLLGLANLTRPLSLPALPAFLLVIVWLTRPAGLRRTVGNACVFVVGLALALTPWLVRQRLVCGITTISDNTADALYAATSPRYKVWTSDIYREPGCNSF